MTLERIIEQAQRRDYTAIGLSDHAYADTYDRILELREQARAIDTGLEVYVGCEVDVLPDGSLGISDDRLAEFDYVLAAPTHQFLGFDPDAADEAACREVLEQWFALTESCCRHPVIDVIAHPLRGLDGGVEAEALINRVEGARLEGLLDRLREARLALELVDSVQNTSSAQALAELNGSPCGRENPAPPGAPPAPRSQPMPERLRAQRSAGRWRVPRDPGPRRGAPAAPAARQP